MPINHSFKKVISLQGHISKLLYTSLPESTKQVKKFEQEHTECLIAIDWSIDRAFQNIHRGLSESIVFTHQVIDSIREIIQKDNVVGAMSEKLFLPQRVTHYILAKKGKKHILPIGDRFFKRFYFEDGLNDWHWIKIREKYEIIFSSEQKSFNDEVTSVYNKIVKEKYKKIFSDNRASKIRKTTYFSKLIARSKKRIFDNIYSEYLFGDFKTGIKSKVVNRITKKRNIKYYNQVTSSTIPEGKFILFLFHMQPEYTVDGIAYDFYNQVEFIASIAKKLPADVSIVVKENPRMIGAKNRNPEYYTELLRHPNIVFLHHSIDAHELIEKSALVLTLTGTVGLEALLLGKPVIVVGNIFYRFFDRIIFASKIDDILINIKNILENGFDGFSNKETQELFGKRVLQSFHDATYPGQMYNGFNPELHRDPKNIQLLKDGFMEEMKKYIS
ncbi:hypothetical protein GCM10007940_34770 [Portibacter lacus]|uniref:Capsule polysaccharide biosynthesis protein n=2 Tax=Portibacter lacus TaxID=1099794 RepID=A0AA37SU86_9BACT|nr:hypothetical protein GCM10007940_34770 [Portibacter lacus]